MLTVGLAVAIFALETYTFPKEDASLYRTIMQKETLHMKRFIVPTYGTSQELGFDMQRKQRMNHLGEGVIFSR